MSSVSCAACVQSTDADAAVMVSGYSFDAPRVHWTIYLCVDCWRWAREALRDFVKDDA